MASCLALFSFFQFSFTFHATYVLGLKSEFYFHHLVHAKYEKLNKSSNPQFPTYEMFISSVFFFL